MEVLVIIVTYKGMRWYDRCFSSLRSSSVPVHTIVIDNASKDNSIEYIRNNYPEIYIIESNENLGFGRANNIGMRYALEHHYDYVFLLNQDAWIEPDTIKTLIHIHLSHKDYGIISPMHLSSDKDHLNFVLDDGKKNIGLLSDLYLGCIKEIYPAIYINAAAWLLPHKTLMTIGGFCPLIFHYGEDDDYLNRARFHNIRVGVCPSARIIHDSKNRLSEGIKLFEKANQEQLDEYLDINKSIDLPRIKLRSLAKGLYYLIVGKKDKSKSFLRVYSILRKYRKDIENCRKKHSIEQPSWLI